MPFGIGKKSKKEPIEWQAPDGPGQQTVPNPGEMPPDWKEQGTPVNSLGAVPPTGNRAGGGAFRDNGARVAYLRNLEFTSGARSAIVGTGTTSPAQPHLSPTTGQVQISGVLGDDQTAGHFGTGPAQAGSAPHPGSPPTKPGQPFGEQADLATGPGPNSPGPGSADRNP